MEGFLLFSVHHIEKGHIMCDYSLKAALQRPAAVSDKIITGSAQGATGTQGFVDTKDMKTAVCLIPGQSAVIFDKAPAVERTKIHGASPSVLERAVLSKVKLSCKAVFVQVDTHIRDTHHDALRFENGEIVKIHRLPEGLRATVAAVTADAVNKLMADANAAAELPIKGDAPTAGGSTVVAPASQLELI